MCVGAQGLSFDAAVRRLEHERKDGDASGFYSSRHKMFGCRPHSPAPHVFEYACHGTYQCHLRWLRSRMYISRHRNSSHDSFTFNETMSKKGLQNLWLSLN